jgi:hypothetical protein
VRADLHADCSACSRWDSARMSPAGGILENNFLHPPARPH